MRKLSKLIKFKPCLSIYEAAELLESLIGEEVEADDIWRLHMSGHLPFVLGGNVIGPLIGVPVTPRADDEPWQMVRDPQDPVHPALFADFLEFPLYAAMTEIAQAPAPILMVDGGIYAWFIDYGSQDGSLPINPEKLTGIDTSNGDNSLVKPAEILRIAACANSNEAASPPPDRSPNHRIWSRGHDGGMVFHEATPISIEDIASKGTHTVNQPQQDPPSFRLAIATLLELLEEPRRPARNQSAVIAEILERHPGVRGLSKRNLEYIFAVSNKATKDAE